MNEGWFGVPSGNLYAWMWVAFFYSVFARALRRLYPKNQKWIWAYPLVPLVCYLLLFLQLNLLGFAARIAGLATPNQRLWLFAVHFILFSLIVFLNWKSREPSPQKPAPIWLWTRGVIHVFFMFLFFHAGIYQSLPVLGFLAAAVMIVDGIVISK